VAATADTGHWFHEHVRGAQLNTLSSPDQVSLDTPDSALTEFMMDSIMAPD
jgi:hypothetical protein